MVDLLFLISFLLLTALYSYAIVNVIPQRLYSFSNLLAGVGALLMGLILGLSLSDMGLNPSMLLRGTIIGLLAGLVLSLIIVCLAAVPGLKHFFTGHASVQRKDAAYQLGFRIPFGTAFFEEVLFRGLFMSLLLRSYGLTTAVVISAIAFGLWHILPTFDMIRGHRSLQKVLGERLHHHLLQVAGVVAVTTVAGVGFALLRNWSGSLIAVWLVHIAINETALISGHRLSWEVELESP